MFKEVWISWKFAKDPLEKAEEMVVWNHSRICMWKSWKGNALYVVYPVMAQKKNCEKFSRNRLAAFREYLQWSSLIKKKQWQTFV